MFIRALHLLPEHGYLCNTWSEYQQRPTEPCYTPNGIYNDAMELSKCSFDPGSTFDLPCGFILTAPINLHRYAGPLKAVDKLSKKYSSTGKHLVPRVIESRHFVCRSTLWTDANVLFPFHFTPAQLAVQPM